MPRLRRTGSGRAAGRGVRHLLRAHRSWRRVPALRRAGRGRRPDRPAVTAAGAAGGRTAMMGELKVTASQLRRTAVIYVRQSTMTQVARNTESTLRQYDLVSRARALGWA